jgi:hypothetical protein
MMEAATTSETSVKFYQTTWRNNPEDMHLHTRRLEKLRPQKRQTLNWLQSIDAATQCIRWVQSSGTRGQGLHRSRMLRQAIPAPSTYTFFPYWTMKTVLPHREAECSPWSCWHVSMAISAATEGQSSNYWPLREATYIEHQPSPSDLLNCLITMYPLMIKPVALCFR